MNLLNKIAMYSLVAGVGLGLFGNCKNDKIIENPVEENSIDSSEIVEVNTPPTFYKQSRNELVFRDKNGGKDIINAYIINKKDTIKLGSASVVDIFPDAAAFKIPDEIYNKVGSFETYAVDSSGNESDIEKVVLEKNIPQLDFLQHTMLSFSPNKAIHIRDNNVGGMKAFMKYDGKKNSLTNPLIFSKKYISFHIPKQLPNGPVTLYLVDREGNELEKTLYSLNDILSTEPYVMDSKEAPELKGVGTHIHFKDDNVVGMKAFANYKNKIVELNPEAIDTKKRVISFEIPKYIVNNNGSFSVYAIDRNNNKSEMETVYTQDKVVSLEKFD